MLIYFKFDNSGLVQVCRYLISAPDQNKQISFFTENLKSRFFLGVSISRLSLKISVQFIQVDKDRMNRQIIPLEVLEQHFKFPLDIACLYLDVTRETLKESLLVHGITRWPYHYVKFIHFLTKIVCKNY
jgi:hypothetical protein